MKLKKITTLFLTIFALAGAGLFVSGCGEKSDADKAEDAVEDAGKDAAEAGKDAAEAGKGAADAGKGAADAIKGIGK